MKKIFAILLAVCAAAAMLGACGKSGDKTDGGIKPLVTITMEDGSVITAELYPDKAPNTVNNFISLVQSGYYDGKVFHRASSDFMIQGGSPNGTSSSEGFPYRIKGEFANNGFRQNDLKHTRGVLSMARTLIADSAGCQFFIVQAEKYPSLDNEYAGFGMVTSGIEAVDAIAALPNSGRPEFLLNTPVTIQSITVDLNGYEFSEPVTIPA